MQAMAWDQHDERLAVLCQGKYTVHFDRLILLT